MKKATGLLLFCFCTLASAQSVRYISDTLEVPLRSGASLRHKILLMLESGTPVTVLKTDGQNGYSRVKTPNGKTGWLLSRFLMEHPDARRQLETANEKLKTLTSANQQQKDALLNSKKQLQQLALENGTLKKQATDLSHQLSYLKKLSGGTIDLDAENKRLQERVVYLEQQVQIARQEKQALVDRSDNALFLTGAGILAAGLVLGLILPGRNDRRQHSWR